MLPYYMLRGFPSFIPKRVFEKLQIIERWVQIAVSSLSRNVSHATESATEGEQPSICIDYNSLKIDHYHTI